jgi:hypothetical protein
MKGTLAMKTSVKYPNQGTKKRFRQLVTMTVNPSWYYATKTAAENAGMSVGVFLETSLPTPAAKLQREAMNQACESMKGWRDMDGNPL